MKIFEKEVNYQYNRVIKKYKLFGITLFKKDKGDFKRYTLFGLRFYRKKVKKVEQIDLDIDKFHGLKKSDNFDSIIPTLDPDSICKIISCDNIKIVSFDVFDTLLVRPVLDPKDIFYLIADKVDKKFNIDFIALRWNVENNLNKKNASIYDIYDHIRVENKLSEQVISELIKEEMSCEYNLLRPREDIKKVYENACLHGKRIIAVSDMYLPEEFLHKVLLEKGYENISKVYVSNTWKKRKDDGLLYEEVIKNECVCPHEICHIGDNVNSDYKIALEHGISAVYYPSIRDIVFAEGSIYNEIWDVSSICEDKYSKLLMGFAIINAFSAYKDFPAEKTIFGGLSQFSKLFITPLLLHIVLNIISKKEILQDYKKIFFASRDGYLPKMVYDIVGRYVEALPSEYLYASRRAYFSGQEENFFEYLKKHHCLGDYTLKDFVNTYFALDDFASKIINKLSDEEKTSLFDNEKSLNILKRFEAEIGDYICHHKKNVSEYYKSLLSHVNGERQLVFDCGYSGSISKALGHISGLLWDKIYLWQTQLNKNLDQENGTKTYTLLGDLPSSFLHIVVEDLFSPCEGSVLGFQNGVAVKENLDCNENMKSDIALMHTETRICVEKFCSMFGEYLTSFVPGDSNVITNSYHLMMTKFKSFSEYNIFNNISFPDPISFSSTKSLSQKMDSVIAWDNVFEGTGFEKANVEHDALIHSPVEYKIGIHIHLYNFYLWDEFLAYLKRFPLAFDLIITIADEKYFKLVSNYFNSVILENLNKLYIKVVPNRGRDIAPWLLYTKNEQKNYDLFCHVHSKASNHFSFGNKWRKYLIKNLLHADSFKNIINFFRDPKVGCIFPDVFPPLKDVCIQHNIPQEGAYGEVKTINALMNRMGIERSYVRSDIFFSEGSMFWYRTSALTSLFNLNLQIEDFPEEPIGVGGTIAHAIERLPALVCKEKGYKAIAYTCFKY